MPANASIVAGSVYRIEGDGGALAAPATLRIETQTMFPQRVSPRTDRKQAQGDMHYVEVVEGFGPTHLCDLDGDGAANDPDDLALRAAGASCYGRPRLVDLSKALGHVGYCAVPDGPSVSCAIQNLGAATLGVAFDAVPPTVSVASTDATPRATSSRTPAEVLLPCASKTSA